jgi:CheY-like chemotaxis protein
VYGDETGATSNQHGKGDVTPAAASARAQQKNQEPFLVLIAEDEEPIAEAIAFLVQDNGYTPLIAHNGRQALELARQHRPALVITDLMMPYLDGDELIRLLRADAAQDQHAPPYTILLSAAGLRRMQNAGADAIMPKPFDLAELEKLLRSFLGQPPDTGKP